MPRLTYDVHAAISRAAIEILDTILPPHPRGRSGQLEDLIYAAASDIIGSRAVIELRRAKRARSPYSPRTLSVLTRGGAVPGLPPEEYWIGKEHVVVSAAERLAAEEQPPGHS